jgi:hypothetical protein
MRISDGKYFEPGWKKFGSGINIPNPQHWQASQHWLNMELDFRSYLGSMSTAVLIGRDPPPRILAHIRGAIGQQR